MNHLGHRLSALVDNELSDVERDHVHAHLARCAQCRAEAAALRELKRQMRRLGEVPANGALTGRLIAIAEPGGPVPPRPRTRRGKGAPRPAFRIVADAVRPAGRTTHHGSAGTAHATDRSPDGMDPSGGPGGIGADDSPGGIGVSGRPGERRHRARYVAVGVVSCVLAGLGATAFTVGGGQATPAPRITPPVQMYSVEHAIVTGEVPFAGSSAVSAPGVSAGSGRP